MSQKAISEFANSAYRPKAIAAMLTDRGAMHHLPNLFTKNAAPSVAVIDDDYFHLHFLSSQFSNLGASVSTFSSGEDFLRHVIDVEKGVCPWDLVVVDYVMPVLDGIQTIRNFTSEMLRDTKVCMLTGSPAALDISYLTELGMKVVKKGASAFREIWSDLKRCSSPRFSMPVSLTPL